jgi:hypothetical protein
MSLLKGLFRIVTAPVRVLRRNLKLRTAKTVERSGAGLVAQRAGDAHSHLEEERSDGAAVRSFLFKRLARPTLVERTAADLSVDEARDYAAQATKFYTYPFPLFTRSDFFYEEVEQDYINSVLGRAEDSADSNFLNIMEDFRKELNANTSRLFLFYTPLLTAMTVATALILKAAQPPALAPLAVAGDFAIEAVVVFVSLGLMLLVYHWPYKVTQQQNLLGLDNYITSKFSRVNQNFQVAKRRAMNIERNMRMPQADELREEAGAWTIAYQWFAMRLLFCEMTVRNTLYQIRRNTTLYGVGGVIVSAALAAAIGLVSGAPLEVAVIAAVFISVSYLVIMGRATRETLSVLQPKEWNRFHHVDLHETIRDHVGEDKLQIVTFRDRNRLE